MSSDEFLLICLFISISICIGALVAERACSNKKGVIVGAFVFMIIFTVINVLSVIGAVP